MNRPKIGISLDWESAKTYSQFPWYALRENYTKVFVSRNCTVFPMVHDLNSVNEYIHSVEGVVITGGAFDVDPRLYGETINPLVPDRRKPDRTNFEMAILKEALNQKKPILGICGGAQVLNVVLGGSLIQSITDTVPHALNHLQSADPHEIHHEVCVTKDTLLYNIVKCDRFFVNSSHRQAVKAPGKGVVVGAVSSEDGIVEAIEYPQHPFCLGVQWHPEFECTQYDGMIFDAFIASCRL